MQSQWIALKTEMTVKDQKFMSVVNLTRSEITDNMLHF